MVDLDLSDEARARSSGEGQARLDKLAAWDLSSAARRAQRRLGWSAAHRSQVEREYRRFLGLVVLNPDKTYGMAGDVDQIWHDHILDTQDYLRMCREVVGGVVHHCPGTAPGRGKRKTAPSRYETETYPDLARTYRGKISRIWPKRARDASQAQCCSHISEMDAA